MPPLREYINWRGEKIGLALALLNKSFYAQNPSLRGRFSGQSNPENMQIDKVRDFSGLLRRLRLLATTNYATTPLAFNDNR